MLASGGGLANYVTAWLDGLLIKPDTC
uniref:Uncharacterized protein n=1 Tax=Anguilla anguilla TaxID=7936 RepID=A0A0E9WE56_ANGAN